MGHANDYEIHLREQKEFAFEEGVAIGREEGREEGEAMAKRDTARNLLDMGMEISAISKATGLPEEEIKALGI